MNLVALFIQGTIKWTSKNIADALIKAGTATRVTGTKLNSAAADAARKNPITKASQLPKSVIDATKKANTPKPTVAKKPGGADRSAASAKGWEKRRANPSEKELQGRANVLAKQKAAAERKKRVAAEKARKAETKANQPPKLTKEERSAKLAQRNAEARKARNEEQLKQMGITEPWTGSPAQKRLYAKFMQNKKAAEAASNQAISSAKQVTREPITPSSQKGMLLPRRGEPTGRKRGGTVGKKRKATGGPVGYSQRWKTGRKG